MANEIQGIRPTADGELPVIGKTKLVTVTFANGATESSVIDIGGAKLAGIFMPAAFDGTTLKFKAAPASDGTFVPSYSDAGNEYTMTVGTSRAVSVDDSLLAVSAFQYIKLVASAQQAARTLTLILKG